MFTPESVGLRDYLSPDSRGRTISDAHHELSLSESYRTTCVTTGVQQLAGRSVLLAVSGQLLSALAMIEIDGVVRRMLLCPPDINPNLIENLIKEAEIDAIVTDEPQRWSEAGINVLTVHFPEPTDVRQKTERATDWLMLTSGTSGAPKIVSHTLDGLCGAIHVDGTSQGTAPVWATFYDIRRYGGLQIFLRAVIGGGSMVLSEPGEPLTDYVARLVARGVTHISGTPSHWRKFLMSGSVSHFSPSYVRLSGEIANQAVLDGLAQAFPSASVGHAYASTEAGVGFAVTDGREGFPASLIGQHSNGVEMKVVDGSLHIRSKRTAQAYIGRDVAALMDSDGFVDTGDMVELRGERYYFVGRRGGIINIGGLKVHPEEIEAVINRHPAVRMSRAKSRRSPITGSIVVADIVLAANGIGRERKIRDEIISDCRDQLAPYKVPVVISFVETLDVTPAGKLARI
ncbi:MAG: fatty acid--CoA ligase family protein [Bradyrhizobium sp.]